MTGFLNRTDEKQRQPPRPLPKVPESRGAPSYGGNLQAALAYLNQYAGGSDDYVARVVPIAGRSAVVVFFMTLIDLDGLERMLRTLQRHDWPPGLPDDRVVPYIADQVISHPFMNFTTNLLDLRRALTLGHIGVLIDRADSVIITGADGVEHRSPGIPIIESATRGAQLGFVEILQVNVGLIRKFLGTDAMRVKLLTVGHRSQTKVAVVYQYDVANAVVVDAAIRRINAVHVDNITGSASLEQRIVDRHWTVFPLTRVTSRVDSVVNEIGQGKVAIVVDGDPMVLLAPATVLDFFQTMDDDQHSFYEATFIRLLRVVALLLSLYLPALYVALTDFNPSLLPNVLGLQIARSREGVPFPAAVEVAFMQTVVEILREATIRMPKVMGQTIGIVGGLVLGEAAVQAGLVSNILLVTIAVTAVAVFVTPSYEFSTVVRLGTWVMWVAASLFGFYGIMLASMLALFHLASLKSFGVPYTDPLTGEHIKDLFIDGITRLPLPMLDRRRPLYHARDQTSGADYTDPVQHPDVDKAAVLRQGR